MRPILTLAVKDLRLLLRDPAGAFFILGFPLIYALFFGSIFSAGGSGGGGKLNVAIVDEDRSPTSRQLIDALRTSESLTIHESSRDAARDAVRRGRFVAYVAVPAGFGGKFGLFRRESAELEVGVDPSRRAEEGFLQGLLMEKSFRLMSGVFTDPAAMQKQAEESLRQVEQSAELSFAQKQILGVFLGSVRSFATSMPTAFGAGGSDAGDNKSAGVEFNPLTIRSAGVARDVRAQPRSSFDVSFPSAMIWGVLGCVAGFATSLVNERIEGTMLRLQTSPLAGWNILAGKATACFLACTGSLTLLMIVAALFFGVRVSNLPLFVVGVVCTALCFVGLMMLFCTIGQSPQAVSGIAWGVNSVMAMLGGGMVPLIAMPGWMQTMSSISPVKWAVISLEGAIWRDYSAGEMLLPCAILLAVGTVGYTLGVLRLNRRLA